RARRRTGARHPGAGRPTPPRGLGPHRRGQLRGQLRDAHVLVWYGPEQLRGGRWPSLDRDHHSTAGAGRGWYRHLHHAPERVVNRPDGLGRLVRGGRRGRIFEAAVLLLTLGHFAARW